MCACTFHEYYPCPFACDVPARRARRLAPGPIAYMVPSAHAWLCACPSFPRMRTALRLLLIYTTTRTVTNVPNFEKKYQGERGDACLSEQDMMWSSVEPSSSIHAHAHIVYTHTYIHTHTRTVTRTRTRACANTRTHRPARNYGAMCIDRHLLPNCPIYIINPPPPAPFNTEAHKQNNKGEPGGT